MSTLIIGTKCCNRCSGTWFSADEELLCPDCRCADLLKKCSVSGLAGIDRHIYNRQIIPGLLAVKDELGIGLDESIEWISWRHERLRKLTPDKFDLSPNASWDMFYS